MKLFLNLILMCASFLLHSQVLTENQKKMAVDMMKSSTSSTFTAAAWMEVYQKNCKNHLNKNEMDYFNEVIQEVLQKKELDAKQRTFKENFSYGYKLGTVKGINEDYGTKFFCDCAHNVLWKDDQTCLDSIEN